MAVLYGPYFATLLLAIGFCVSPCEMARLQGKTALVTGSSSGLGREICIAYAREGANVCCVDLYPAPRNVVDPKTGQARIRADDWNNRDQGGLATHELLREQYGSSETKEGGVRFNYVKADISYPSDVENAVKHCVETFGRLDIMVNNAGISVESTNTRPLKVHETSEDAWDRTMAINAKGVFLGCKYACRQMLEQDVKQEWGGDRGWIVNTASTQGLIAFRGTRTWVSFLLAEKLYGVDLSMLTHKGS